jgi:Domain of unknown function (DUF4926)
MKIPGGDAAIVDRQKLTGYCLNPEHPRGKHKSRVFATLGFTAENADELRTALLRAAASGVGRIRRSLCARVWDWRPSRRRDRQEHLDREARRECSPFDKLFREVEATAMHTKPHLLDVVALLSDAPAHGLLRGQVGTVVELLDGAYEVEFSDDGGKTYAELALTPDQLLVLHHRPQWAA